MNFIYFVHYTPIVEHPNQQAVIEKRFYLRIDYLETDI